MSVLKIVNFYLTFGGLEDEDEDRHEKKRWSGSKMTRGKQMHTHSQKSY